jgi:hypothetical protein
MPPEADDPAEAERMCRYCGSAIATQATICPTCRSYQSPWRNTVLFLAGVAGFFALIGSSAAFIWNQIDTAYRNVQWEDKVTVLYFSAKAHPDFEIVMSNVGSGTVFVSDLQVFYWRGNTVFRIDKAIEPGTISASEVAGDDGADRYRGILASPTGKATSAILEDSDIVPILRIGDGSDACFHLNLYSNDASDLERMDNFYKANGLRLVTEPVQAVLSYYSVESNSRISDRYSLTATFAASASEDCRRRYQQRPGSNVDSDLVAVGEIAAEDVAEPLE